MHNFILFLHKEEGGQGSRRTVETSALINMIVFIQATKVGSFLTRWQQKLSVAGIYSK